MRIAYDVSPLSQPRTGVGNYVLSSLRGLVENRADVVAFAPVSARGKQQVEDALHGLDVERRLRVLPAAHAWRTAWSRAGRPSAERWLGPFDVLHFSDWMYPPQRAGVRATTIHDLVPLRHPEWVHARAIRMHRAKYAHAARTAHLFMCNSRFTEQEVRALLGVEPERTRVAYPAPAPVFRPEGGRANLGRPYVLTVATLEPRKNLDTLLAAHELVASELALAVVGAAGWGKQPRLDREGVIRLGYVADEELARLYRGAAAFAYPSRFEGFGIPLLEAMACDVPVVASAHESLDEAAGGAVLRADPESPQAWADALREAVARRAELVTKGRTHVSRFTNRAMGAAFLAAYDEARDRLGR